MIYQQTFFMEQHNYQINVEWNADRVGMLSASEINVTFPVATPPEFAGGVPGIWSPEHLYTASIASCFMTTFLAIAELSKLPFKSFSCNATGVLEKVDGKFMMTKVILNPTVVIEQDKDTERASRILQKSESACLITNSVKSAVTMTPTILVHS